VVGESGIGKSTALRYYNDKLIEQGNLSKYESCTGDFDLEKWKQANFGTTENSAIFSDLVSSDMKPTFIIDHFNKLINKNP